jgi:hypothetical protein
MCGICTFATGLGETVKDGLGVGGAVLVRVGLGVTVDFGGTPCSIPRASFTCRPCLNGARAVFKNAPACSAARRGSTAASATAKR